MQVSYNWLCTFFDPPLKLSADKVAEILTQTGLEVEGMTTTGVPEKALREIVVGEVREVAPHPDADRLQVATVSTGKSTHRIVCGAPNLKQGQKGAVALPGATIHPLGHKPVKIKKAKIRGVASDGMLCAEDELGLSEEHDGILVLPDHAQPGRPLTDYLEAGADTVFEIGLTPNRADAMSHYGVARDLYAYLAVYDKKPPRLKKPEAGKLSFPDTKAPVKIRVEDQQGCPRYAGLTIEGVEVKPSPAWMQRRLQAIGIQPRNNVVDATNYVLWELGQPLHAFDLDAIEGDEVVVRTLKQNTAFDTLEGETRKLHGDDLMICNAKAGMCIAGVLGGTASGVKDRTTAIFLESAYFDPSRIRQTAQRHHIRTDASNRFEKGADPDMVLHALQRAAALILEAAGGKLTSGILDHYPAPVRPFEVRFSTDYLRRLAGQPIKVNTITTILKALDIEVKQQKKGEWLLQVPPYRVDVQRPADVAEEVLRIYGYNRIKTAARVNYALPEVTGEARQQLRDRVGDYLAANGFYEVMNTSLVGTARLDETARKQAVPVLNYSSEALNALRPDLFFSGLQMLQYNRNRGTEDVKCFEFGKAYRKEKQKYHEAERLALWVTGRKQPERWNAPDGTADFYHLKGFVVRVLELAGCRSSMETVRSAPATDSDQNLRFVPKPQDRLEESVNIQFGKKTLGVLGKVSAELAQRFDLVQAIYYADLDWAALRQAAEKHRVTFEPLPRYPGTRRDLALVLDRDVSFEALEKLARQHSPEWLRAVDVFDVYAGKNIPKGKKSYALRFHFRHDKRTLKDNEVDRVMDKLVKAFKRETGAVLRG